MTVESYKPKSADEIAVLDLYYNLISAWNERDAHSFAKQFSGTANIVGFDGSQMQGQEQVEKELTQIFSGHQTGRYVIKLRDIRHLGKDCLLLTAIAGMITGDNNALNPSVNAIQSLVAVKHDETWHIELFQNTPAQFHGRPEMAEAFTNELNELIQQDA